FFPTHGLSPPSSNPAMTDHLHARIPTRSPSRWSRQPEAPEPQSISRRGQSGGLRFLTRHANPQRPRRPLHQRAAPVYPPRETRVNAPHFPGDARCAPHRTRARTGPPKKRRSRRHLLIVRVGGNGERPLVDSSARRLRRWYLEDRSLKA